MTLSAKCWNCSKLPKLLGIIEVIYLSPSLSLSLSLSLCLSPSLTLPLSLPYLGVNLCKCVRSKYYDHGKHFHFVYVLVKCYSHGRGPEDKDLVGMDVGRMICFRMLYSGLYCTPYKLCTECVWVIVICCMCWDTATMHTKSCNAFHENISRVLPSIALHGCLIISSSTSSLWSYLLLRNPESVTWPILSPPWQRHGL